MKKFLNNKIPKGKGFSSGFTIVELLVAIGIASTLLGFTTINLMGAQRTAITTSAAESLIADVKKQQVRAMNGVSGSSGVHFESDGYTLFQGTAFDPNNPLNLFVELSGNLVSSTFPNNTLVFLPISGEIDNFSETANTIVLQASGGSGQIITVNRYGVITGVE